MTTVGIVACSKTKLNHAAPARELYTSQLFRAARAYCEATYDRWLILSALHGLVEPDQVIEPYDVTLARMTAADRTAWGVTVLDQVIAAGLADRSVQLYVHAGQRYRHPFALMIPPIIVPLAGFGIGQQLGWYAAKARERQP